MKLERKRKEKSSELQKALKEVSKLPRVKMGLFVDAAQYKKLKMIAAEKSITVTDIIAASIEMYLAKTDLKSVGMS